METKWIWFSCGYIIAVRCLKAKTKCSQFTFVEAAFLLTRHPCGSGRGRRGCRGCGGYQRRRRIYGAVDDGYGAVDESAVVADPLHWSTMLVKLVTCGGRWSRRTSEVVVDLSGWTYKLDWRMRRIWSRGNLKKNEVEVFRHNGGDDEITETPPPHRPQLAGLGDLSKGGVGKAESRLVE